MSDMSDSSSPDLKFSTKQLYKKLQILNISPDHMFHIDPTVIEVYPDAKYAKFGTDVIFVKLISYDDEHMIIPLVKESYSNYSSRLSDLSVSNSWKMYYIISCSLTCSLMMTFAVDIVREIFNGISLINFIYIILFIITYKSFKYCNNKLQYYQSRLNDWNFYNKEFKLSPSNVFDFNKVYPDITSSTKFYYPYYTWNQLVGNKRNYEHDLGQILSGSLDESWIIANNQSFKIPIIYLDYKYYCDLIS